MANFYGHARTNYFRVKDVEAFTAALPDDFEVVTGGNGTIAVLVQNEYGGWEGTVWAEGDDEQDVDFDVIGLIAEHLADGEVAVAQSVGNEKLRYLNGFAIAVNNTGERVQISIDDIYKAAADTFGVAPEKITLAHY